MFMEELVLIWSRSVNGYIDYLRDFELPLGPDGEPLLHSQAYYTVNEIPSAD